MVLTGNFYHKLITLSCKENFTDNCCADRKHLTEIFPSAIIKQDLFHLIQRITSTIKSGMMRRVKRTQFFGEVKSVFRADGDQTEKRLDIVPPKEVLALNIESLRNKWGSIIPVKTKSALKNCEDHLQCVENLKINQGTSKNEKVHAILNALFSGRINVSPDFAMALIAMRLSIYNNRILKKSDPLFYLVKTDCTEPSEIFTLEESEKETSASEIFFPPESSFAASEDPNILRPSSISEEIHDCIQTVDASKIESVNTSINLYRTVLGFFNEDEISYQASDVIFHCPPYSGRQQVKPSIMKERDFNLLVKRLNVEISDGPFQSLRETLTHEIQDFPEEIQSSQNISDHLGTVIVTISNDSNKPVTTHLPAVIRLYSLILLRARSNYLFQG